MTIHFGLATLTKSPRLKLTEEEATLYADAAQRVMDLYEIEILSPEKRAWFNLLWVMGCIYVPRLAKPKPDQETRAAAAPPYYQPPKQPISVDEAFQEHLRNNKPVQ